MAPGSSWKPDAQGTQQNLFRFVYTVHINVNYEHKNERYGFLFKGNTFDAPVYLCVCYKWLIMMVNGVLMFVVRPATLSNDTMCTHCVLLSIIRFHSNTIEYLKSRQNYRMKSCRRMALYVYVCVISFSPKNHLYMIYSW